MLLKHPSRGSVICKRWCLCIGKSAVSALWTCCILRIFFRSFRNKWKQWALRIFIWSCLVKFRTTQCAFPLSCLSFTLFSLLRSSLHCVYLILMLSQDWLSICNCSKIYAESLCLIHPYMVRFFFKKKKKTKFCKLLGFFCVWWLFLLCYFFVMTWYIAWQKVMLWGENRETGTEVLLLPAESYLCLILTLLWNWRPHLSLVTVVCWESFAGKRLGNLINAFESQPQILLLLQFSIVISTETVIEPVSEVCECSNNSPYANHTALFYTDCSMVVHIFQVGQSVCTFLLLCC